MDVCIYVDIRTVEIILTDIRESIKQVKNGITIVLKLTYLELRLNCIKYKY